MAGRKVRRTLELASLSELLDSEFSSIRITDYALKKIRLYSSLTTQIFGSELECGGFLLGESGSGIVEDAALFPKQEVSRFYYLGDPSYQHLILSEISDLSELSILGWWHSHNSMPAFHSYVDEQNFEALFRSISNYNRKKIFEFRNPVDGIDFEGADSLRIRLTDSRTVEISGLMPNSQVSAFEVEVVSSGFAYSIVVSSSDENGAYAEVMFEEPGTGSILKRIAQISVLQSQQHFDEDDSALISLLSEEIKKKIIPVEHVKSDKDSASPDPIVVGKIPAEENEYLSENCVRPENISLLGVRALPPARNLEGCECLTLEHLKYGYEVECVIQNAENVLESYYRARSSGSAELTFDSAYEMSALSELARYYSILNQVICNGGNEFEDSLLKKAYTLNLRMLEVAEQALSSIEFSIKCELSKNHLFLSLLGIISPSVEEKLRSYEQARAQIIKSFRLTRNEY
ncbi:MAG: hypothetical protein QW471_00520 [Candidatus Woesearchaeota archaeon]